LSTHAKSLTLQNIRTFQLNSSITNFLRIKIIIYSHACEVSGFDCRMPLLYMFLHLYQN